MDQDKKRTFRHALLTTACAVAGAVIGSLAAGVMHVPSWVGSGLGATLGLIPWLLHTPKGGPSEPLPAVSLPIPTIRARESAFLEVLPEPALLIDPTGRIALINGAAKTRFGLAETGSRFDAIIRRPELVEALRAALEDNRTSVVPFASLGSVERHEVASVAPILMDGKRQALLTLRDETENVLAERRRADFIANASHELRTPLASLSGFIETLRGHARNDPEARERFLEIMQAQAERMRRLIDGLLSLSRIELNEHVPPTGRTDLAAVASEVTAAMGPVAAQKKVTLNLHGVDIPIWIVGEWDELIQIAHNLLDNAIKYSPDGAVVDIDVGASRDHEAVIFAASRQWPEAARLSLVNPPLETGRRFAHVRITNEGEGIERWHLPRLSERFYRVEGQPTTRSGTGLGLAIVKHIVNRHRGGLTVESVVGKGTAFAFYVPQPDDLES